MASFWTDAYQQAFQQRFQKPFDIQVFHDADGLALKLATYDWARHGYRVYASMGLADKLIENDEDDFGEVILFSDVDDVSVPQLFMNALFFILRHDIPLGSRFAIGGIAQMHPAFAKRYGRAALYFRLAEETETFSNKVRRGEQFGRIYQAYFLTPEEDAYLDEYGAEAFAKRFEEQEGDRNSVRRPSCVKANEPRTK
jgi:hypothetical protein